MVTWKMLILKTKLLQVCGGKGCLSNSYVFQILIAHLGPNLSDLLPPSRSYDLEDFEELSLLQLLLHNESQHFSSIPKTLITHVEGMGFSTKIRVVALGVNDSIEGLAQETWKPKHPLMNFTCELQG
jgi:hypothetical protein